MSTRSRQRFLFIIASVLFACFCISRHSMSTNYLTDQLPTVSALLAIGCIQPRSSVANHAPSTSLQLLRRYASALVGVAILSHHSAEAELREVNETTFKDTWYNGSAVSLKGKNIFVTLDASVPVSITWTFISAWQILLEKCDNETAKIEVSDSCKWEIVWDEMLEFKLRANDIKWRPWELDKLKTPRPPIRKLQISISESEPPSLSLCAVADDNSCPSIRGSVDLGPPDYCMLATDNFSVNMTLTQTKCPVNVTIMNAQLLYDFPEPTTTPAATVSQNDGRTTGYATRPSTSTTETPPGFPTWAIIVASVGGLVGLLVIIGIVGLIVFCCLPRRRRRQTQLGNDADIQAQVTEKEGLVEWDDIMAHAPYKPKLKREPDETEWPFKQGDKVQLSTITASFWATAMSGTEDKELAFTEDVKGSEDYGGVEGSVDGEYAVDIYYSRPPDRVKIFVDRLNRLSELANHYTDLARALNPARVPHLRHYWVSPDHEKLSYFVVDFHGNSVAQDVKDGAEFHARVGFAYTTFAALMILHRLGFVHRDVSPAAFVIRNKTNEKTDKRDDRAFCLICHLSLSRVLYNVIDKTWMPRRRRVNYFGTHKYASRAAHAMQERSFKDDLESWFFTAVELIWPTTAKEPVMPWHILNLEIGVTDRAELHAKYKTAKEKFLRTFAKNNLIVTFPAPQFRVFAKEILKMTYETMASDYAPRFSELLNVMIDQLPTQVDEASQQDVVKYMQSFNANGCRLPIKATNGEEAN